jgi:hypothetical protein
VAVGDIDNDGIIDLATGDPYDDVGGIDRGAVWILFMNSDGTVRNSKKLILSGNTQDRSYAGTSLAAISDIDGNGVPDLAVGIPNNGSLSTTTNHGKIVLLELSNVGNIVTQTTIRGGSDDVFFGSSLTYLGDPDGDGNIELAVGTQVRGTAMTDGFLPAVKIMEFPSGDLTAVITKSTISDSSGGFTGSLVAGQWFGKSLASIADLDGDGVDDLLVGAPSYPYYGYYQGSAYNGDNAVTPGIVRILYMNTDGTVK